MWDLDAIVTKYTDRVRPHLVRVGDISNMFATGVIERLDRIADGVADDTHVVRLYFDLPAVPALGTVIAGTVTPVDLTSRETRVPSDEQWHLESWFAHAGGGTAFIFANGIPVARTGIPQTSPNVTPGLVIPGATVLQVGCELGASPTVQMRLQFRVHKRIDRAPAWSGQMNPDADRLDDRQEAALERRHAGTFTAGRQTVGERVEDL